MAGTHYRHNTVACIILLAAYLVAAPSLHSRGVLAARDSSDLKKLAECRKRAASLCGPSAFTFYMHNTVYNPAVDNADYFNSVYGPSPNVTWPNPYAFGTTSTFEDPITEGPANDSQRIGTGQGFWQLVGKQEYVLFYIFTANITEGAYQGTLDIFGQMREVDPVRYLTVIGGTGDFLGARGLASNRLVSIDHTAPAKFTLSFDLDLYY